MSNIVHASEGKLTRFFADHKAELKGDKGDQGIQGAQGDSGYSPVVTTASIQGGTRVTITDGSGAKTFDVMNGAAGAQGATGAKGDKGDKGDTGAKGDQGIQGVQGIQGAQGEKGEKGDKGDTGSKGDTGAKGDKGDTGAKGDTGEKGDAGVGVPSGGTTGQYLMKKSSTDFDTEWHDGGCSITDVQVDGTSVVTAGVANVTGMVKKTGESEQTIEGSLTVGAVYVGGTRVEVVSSVPASPIADTLYFITGS